MKNLEAEKAILNSFLDKTEVKQGKRWWNNYRLLQVGKKLSIIIILTVSIYFVTFLAIVLPLDWQYWIMTLQSLQSNDKIYHEMW